MQSALVAKALMDPQVRQLAKTLGLGAVKALGRSRRRRQKRGKWYAGKRLGIPANLVQQAPIASAAVWQKGPTAATNRVVNSEILTSLTLVNEPDGRGYFSETYSLNPAEPHTFERLAAIAGVYQKYRIDSFSLEYISQMPTTSKGLVGFAFLSDPTSSGPGSFSELTALAGSVTGAGYTNIKIPMPPALQAAFSKTYLCKRMTSPDADDDSPFNSAARLVFATQSSEYVIGDTLGNIVARYSITFSEPRPSTNGALCSGYQTDMVLETDTINFENAITHGTPAMYPLRGHETTLLKRVSHEVQLIVIGPAAMTECHMRDLLLEEDVNPHLIETGATYTLALITLPRGRSTYELKATGAAPTRFISISANSVLTDL